MPGNKESDHPSGHVTGPTGTEGRTTLSGVREETMHALRQDAMAFLKREAMLQGTAQIEVADESQKDISPSCKKQPEDGTAVVQIQPRSLAQTLSLPLLDVNDNAMDAVDSPVQPMPTFQATVKTPECAEATRERSLPPSNSHAPQPIAEQDAAVVNGANLSLGTPSIEPAVEPDSDSHEVPPISLSPVSAPVPPSLTKIGADSDSGNADYKPAADPTRCTRIASPDVSTNLAAPPACLSEDAKRQSTQSITNTGKLILVQWVHKEGNIAPVYRLTRFAPKLLDAIRSDLPDSFVGKQQISFKPGHVKMSAEAMFEKYSESIVDEAWEDCLQFLMDEAFGDDAAVERVWKTVTVIMRD